MPRCEKTSFTGMPILTGAGSRKYCPCTVNPEFSIQWDELQHLTFIAEGGFGNVYSATWRYCEVCEHRADPLCKC